MTAVAALFRRKSDEKPQNTVITDAVPSDSADGAIPRWSLVQSAENDAHSSPLAEEEVAQAV